MTGRSEFLCYDSDMNQPTQIEPAATLILLRQGSQGAEVLLQQRHQATQFAGGAWVFPGGKLEPADADPEWSALLGDFDNDQAQQRLTSTLAAQPYNAAFIEADAAEQVTQLAIKPLAYWIAGLREVFEEAGILLTRQTLEQTKLDRWRRRLLHNEQSWLDLIRQQNLNLAVTDMHYLSRWITPADNPRRYDTRFFIAKMPANQIASHEDIEAVETCWISPEKALQRWREKQMQFVYPTLFTLNALQTAAARHNTLDELIAHVEYFFHHEEPQHGSKRP